MLRFSGPDYWKEGNSLLECRINIKDVITVQRGKVRCKKVFVLREII